MTSSEPGWTPPGTDTSKASSARVYDYWLGGDHNFQVDRDLARAAIAVNPNIRAAARANRAFLGRAVRYLASQGIRQFLDIGSGIPTSPNVHEIAQQAAPGCRVVYVDNDDIAYAHSQFILRGNDNAVALRADLRDPGAILSDDAVRRLIDFGQPTGLILSGVLHFIADDTEAAAIVAALRDALAPGSHLVVVHGCQEVRPEMTSYSKVYNHRSDSESRLRTRAEIERLLDGFTLLDPGLVWIPQWRPDSPDDVPADPENYWSVVGVARYDG